MAMISDRQEMRVLGAFYKKLLHANDSLENARKANKLCEVFENKWLGRNTKMRTEYVERLDGSTLRICIVNAKKDTNNNKKTGLLWLHGGGYSIGMPEQEFITADLLIEDDSAVMIIPDYKKSTEAPYPAALEDAYLTLVWMVVNAERLNINLDQIFVGGESAGGGLCAALTQFARDEGEINIAFQMPLYPMLDDRATSTNKNNNAPVWNSRLNDANWQFYKRGLKAVDKYCAPARETNYSNLPPAYSFVGTVEPFYAETCAYMDNLYKAGVPIMFREYKDCYHAFDLLAYHTESARHARKMTKKVFKYAQANFFKKQNSFHTEKEIIRDLEDSNEFIFNNELEEIDSLLDTMDYFDLSNDYSRRNK